MNFKSDKDMDEVLTYLKVLIKQKDNADCSPAKILTNALHCYKHILDAMNTDDTLTFESFGKEYELRPLIKEDKENK